MSSRDQYGSINEPALVPEKRFGVREKVALVAVCLTHLGDAVEIYLPAILTQDISCDLKLDTLQHGVLSVVFYSFYAAGSFASGWLADRIGRRKTITISLGLSFVVSVLASFSHEFYLLLASRACTGVLVGSNYGISNVYWSEIAPSIRIKNLGLFLASLCFSFGAGYTSLLAYFILPAWGWRLFFVSCSLPIFVFPFGCFLFYLDDTEKQQSREEEGEVVWEVGQDQAVWEVDHGQELPDEHPRIPWPVKLLIAQLSLIYLVNICQGWGLILFVPAVYSHQNVAQGANTGHCSSIFGEQYIKMTLISGIGPLAAKLCAYLASFVINLPFSMLLSSAVTTFSFLVMCALPATTHVTDIMMGLVKASFAHLNLTLWLYMMGTFEGRTKTTATVIIDGSSKMGAMLGSSFVAFLPMGLVVRIMSGLGICQTGTVLFIVMCAAFTAVKGQK